MFQHNLVDNPGTRFPESYPKFVRNACEKLVHFFIVCISTLQIIHRTDFGLYQVIAMDRGRNGNRCSAGRHELQKCHLCRSILHRNTIRGKINITFSPFPCFVWCFKIMGIQDLFCEC